MNLNLSNHPITLNTLMRMIEEAHQICSRLLRSLSWWQLSHHAHSKEFFSPRPQTLTCLRRHARRTSCRFCDRCDRRHRRWYSRWWLCTLLLWPWPGRRWVRQSRAVIWRHTWYVLGTGRRTRWCFRSQLSPRSPLKTHLTPYSLRSTSALRLAWRRSGWTCGQCATRSKRSRSSWWSFILPPWPSQGPRQERRLGSSIWCLSRSGLDTCRQILLCPRS